MSPEKDKLKWPSRQKINNISLYINVAKFRYQYEDKSGKKNVTEAVDKIHKHKLKKKYYVNYKRYQFASIKTAEIN